MAEYQRIHANHAKKMLDSDKKIILLDVRTAEEYEQKHIPGAKLIPNEVINDHTTKEISKDNTILVYCRSGNRSRQATEKLLKLGYTDVYDFGGINEWSYEIEGGAYKRE